LQSCFFGQESANNIYDKTLISSNDKLLNPVSTRMIRDF